MQSVATNFGLDLHELRLAIQEEYREVALHPEQGFHFHTGRSLAALVGYEDEWLRGIPESAIESFAGTGNPFSMGELRPGENVVDVGCGPGIDSLIAARMVGPDGRVMGIDMMPDMLEKAPQSSSAADFGTVGINFRARKATSDEEWFAALADLTCEMPARR